LGTLGTANTKALEVFKDAPGVYYQDISGKRMRMDIGTNNGVVETLNRYDLGIGYSITTTSCRATKIGSAMADLFWPWLTYATNRGPTVLPDGTRCNEYTYVQGTTGLYACVLSSDDATPVILNVNANDGQTYYRFLSFSPATPNPSVFAPPTSCNTGAFGNSTGSNVIGS